MSFNEYLYKKVIEYDDFYHYSDSGLIDEFNQADPLIGNRIKDAELDVTGSNTFVSYLRNVLYSDLAALQDGHNISFLGINLTRFAPLNDFISHDLGDEVLQKVVSTIKDITGAEVYRYQGVNFIFRVVDCEAGEIAEKLNETFLSQDFTFDVDLGKINENNRKSFLNAINQESSEKLYEGVSERKSINVLINNEIKEIFSEIYKNVKINKVLMPYKGDHVKNCPGMNIGIMNLVGNQKWGRTDIVGGITDLINVLQENTNLENISEVSINPTDSSYENDFDILQKMKLVSNTRSVKSSMADITEEYEVEDLKNEISFINRTKDLFIKNVGLSKGKDFNIELIHDRDPEIVEKDKDRIKYDTNEIFTNGFGYVVMPLFNDRGNPIAFLRFHGLQKEDINDEQEFINFMKFIEKRHNLYCLFSTNDNLSGLPTMNAYKEDLRKRIERLIEKYKKNQKNKNGNQNNDQDKKDNDSEEEKLSISADDFTAFGAFVDTFGPKSCDKVKVNSVAIMKKLEEKYKNINLKFYLAGGEEFKMNADCDAKMHKEIMDELNQLYADSSVLKVRPRVSLTKILMNLNRLTQVGPEKVKEARMLIIKDFVKKYVVSEGVDILQIPRLHGKSGKIVKGLSGSSGVVELSNIEKVVKKAVAIGFDTSMERLIDGQNYAYDQLIEFLIGLGNYIQEKTKEDATDTQILDITN